MTDNHNTPYMNWSSLDLPGTFKLFKKKCEIFFTVRDIKPEKRVSHMLLYVGDEGLRIFNSWTLSDSDREKSDVLWAKFEEHLEPKVSFRVQRYYLQRLSQTEGESNDGCMTRCKLQALKCKFNQAELEERLIEQLIVGTRLSKLQKELLAKDENLTLDQALNIVRTQASISHMSQLRGMQTGTDVHSIRTVNKSNCHSCGRQHTTKERCPAHGSTCRKCGRKNHWQAVCKKHGRGNWKPRTRSRSRHDERSLPQRNDGPTFSREGKRDVHLVEQANTESHDQMTSQFEHFNFATMSRLPNATSAKDTRDEVFATLDIRLPNKGRGHTADLKVKIDTGAQGNILPLRIFRRMFPEKLTAEGYRSHGSVANRTNTTLSVYNDSRIPQYGSITLPCRYSCSEWVYAEFFLTDTNGPAILGLPDSHQLKFVTLHCAIDKGTCSPHDTGDHSPVKSVEDLKQLYADRFESLGHFPGTYHIVLDPNVQPTIHAPRKCPIQMKDEIKSELESDQTCHRVN